MDNEAGGLEEIIISLDFFSFLSLARMIILCSCPSLLVGLSFSLFISLFPSCVAYVTSSLFCSILNSPFDATFSFIIIIPLFFNQNFPFPLPT